MVVSFIRTILLYLFIITILRVMGKRQIAELEPSELVVTILISDLAAVPMQDLGMPLLGAVVTIATLAAMELFFSETSMRSPRLRSILCGKPVIVVENGLPIRSQMKRTRLTLDELFESLRQKSVTDLSSVKYAILETGGQLSVILKSEAQPATAKQVSATLAEHGLPVMLINDGRVLTNNLGLLGLDEQWIKKQLQIHGVKSPSQVFLLTIDGAGSICFVGRETKQREERPA